MVDVDSETLFNGAAAALTTLAVLFFLFNVEFGYSPASKVAIVLSFLALVVAVSQRTDDAQLTLFGYGVVVVSVVGLFFEVVNTFEIGDELTVFGLLAFAGVLFALRTRFDERNHLLTGSQATRLLGIVTVLTVVVLGVDVATGGLAYELRVEPQIEVAESTHGELRVGSLAVTNPTPLPERVETPAYAACAAGDWSDYRLPSDPGRERQRSPRVDLHVEHGYNDHVASFGSRTYPVRLYLDAANATGETFRIERTSSCPDDESGTPFVAIYERASDERRAYPA
ncbi:hypothetical protein DVK02_10040 [Halobellus sp. Atlit-31R]|nr:hypothetical protein DVK02_10040 [Halobellus sp. Atlit-31R]